jgi:hypothetical protein
MREIKFRIWDEAKNEWLASSNKDALPYYGFALVGEVMTVQSPPVWSLDEGNVVEQFTGLKDKNGTEIYEGDVVIYGKLTYSIGYQSSRFMLCAPCRLSICLSELVYDCDTNQLNCEVIGNIHENHELLEENNDNR